jgi:hypothetical protein
MTAQLLEDAERFPTTFGLSHAAAGDEERKGNRNVVTRISEVFSVDIVSDPATCSGLFESEVIVQTTIGKLLEANTTVPFAKILRDDLLVRFREEMGSDPMAIPVDTADSSSAEDQVSAAFKAAMMAVLDDESLDDAGKLAKLKAIMKAHGQAKDAVGSDTASDTTPDAGSDAGGMDMGSSSSDTTPPTTESLKAQVAKLTEENRKAKDRLECQKLLESKKRLVNETRITALMAVAPSVRGSLIEEWPEVGSGPRERPTYSPSKMSESISGGDYPSSMEEFKKRLR